MIYRIIHPLPVLSDIVAYYWYTHVDSKESMRQQYATPLLEGLAFNLKNQTEQHSFNGSTLTLNKSAYFFGQPVSPRVITTDEKGIDIIGVKFKPLGISKITGIKMEYLADAIIPADDIWGKEVDTLCDAMRSQPSMEQVIFVLEDFLLKKYASVSIHHRADSVQNALNLISRSKGNIHIKTLQEQTNTTRKTLERAFINYMGVHPKLYTRIVRFNAVKQTMDKAMSGRPKSVLLATDFGFYDSAHFISEFKHFAGCTPQAYLKTLPVNLVYKDL